MSNPEMDNLELSDFSIGDVFVNSKGDKGEKGDKPTDEELIALIKPLIPDPIPGEKGERGERGFPGRDGRDGRDADENTIVNKVIAQIPKEDTQKIYDALMELDVRINELPTVEAIIKDIRKTKAIDISEIKNANLYRKKLDMSDQRWHGGGVSSNQFVNNEIPSGTIDGANKTFTLANTPTSATLRVYADGLRMALTSDYSLSGTTITFIVAPTSQVLCDYIKA